MLAGWASTGCPSIFPLPSTVPLRGKNQGYVGTCKRFFFMEIGADFAMSQGFHSQQMQPPLWGPPQAHCKSRQDPPCHRPWESSQPPAHQPLGWAMTAPLAGGWQGANQSPAEAPTAQVPRQGWGQTGPLSCRVAVLLVFKYPEVVKKKKKPRESFQFKLPFQIKDQYILI